MTDTPSDQPTGDMTSDSDGRDGDGMVTRWMKAVSDQPDASVEDKAGDQVGAYRLIRQIGEGGFGTVWLAERKQPFTQRVALKLIKPGMDSKSVIARFEQERQALAVMNHPGIAKVLDGGLTPKGRPYFAMEFVKGEAITEFCDRRCMSIHDRLELFAQACEAVQHAHLKGIVHRDIKPSNILAFEVEGDKPRLKVIDFGVAKAMSQTLTEKTIFTETGQMIGTPAYMSPEQADPTLTDIDTRSDIYSLGVLLYELVTGALPFDPKELRAKGYLEIQRVIREQDPPTPSARVTTLASGDATRASTIEKERGIALRQLARTLRSELEWIPLKAMRKEPKERYQTALDFARDVRSYLEGKPISAAPESSLYRIRKWARRRRGRILSLSVLVFALILGASAHRVALLIREIGTRLEFFDLMDAHRDRRERMGRYTIVRMTPDPSQISDPDIRQRIAATNLPWHVRHIESGIELLLVPPGDFVMGPDPEIYGNDPDWRRRVARLQYRRSVTKPFYLSITEVSNSQWRRITGKSEFPDDDLPCTSVSWTDVNQLFIASSNHFFRLPTEVEWEYACRAGTSTAYFWGNRPPIPNQLTELNEQGGVLPLRPATESPSAGLFRCGSTRANPWGFREMLGNVEEMIEDSCTDPLPERGTEEAVRGDSRLCVVRGGHVYTDGVIGRNTSYFRECRHVEQAHDLLGFRVASSPERWDLDR